MSMEVEHLTGAEVVDLDARRAIHARDRFIAALDSSQRSSLELMEAFVEAHDAKAWLTDEDFRAEMAAGRIAVDVGNGINSAFVAWVQYRSKEIKGAYVYQLLNSGRARQQLAEKSTIVDFLPVTEGGMRPLQKLFRPRYLPSETRDDEALNAAAVAVWEQAVSHEPTPTEAAKKIAKYIKQSDFAPLRRSVTKPNSQKTAEKAEAIARARKAMRVAGEFLLGCGAFDVYDAMVAELDEIRQRVSR